MSFVFALPKGRLGESLAKRLADSSLAPRKDPENPRALTLPTGDPRVSAVWLKGRDLVRYVARGAATFGVVGSDVLGEEDERDDLLEVADLGIGKCTLALAAPRGITEADLRKRAHLKLATKYVRATARWLDAEGLTAELLHIESSVEIAPKLGLSHAIVDLVETGETLRANDLEVLRPVVEVSGRLVVSRAAWLTERTALREIVREITNAVATYEAR